MIGNYLTAAWRNLARNGLYAGITISGLTVAFAAAILIGIYLRHELSYDRFIPDAERVFLVGQVRSSNQGRAVDSAATPEPLAELLKLDVPEIELAARLSITSFPPAVRRGDLNVREGGLLWADPDLFKILRVPALAGDPGTALESPDAIVLTRAAARKYFGRDTPLGGRLLVDGNPMRVAAVIEDLPSNSHLTGELFASARAAFSAISRFSGGGFLRTPVATYVRLRPGANAAVAADRLAGLASQRIKPALDRTAPEQRLRLSLYLKPLTRIHLEPADQGDFKPGADLKVLTGIGLVGGLIVAVAAINFVTLTTARAARRAKEVGVRKALGAGRRDLIIQFLGEALLQVLLAVVLALVLAQFLLPLVNAGLQRRMVIDYLHDPQLIATVIVTTVLTGVAAGLYPAFILSSFRPAAVLKDGSVAAAGGAGLRRALVIGQFAALVILIVATLTILRQTQFALRDATNTDKTGVLLLFASPCTEGLRDAVRGLAGVQGAACASPGAVNLAAVPETVEVGGRRSSLLSGVADFGFFEIYGVRPLAGRVQRPDRAGDDGGRLVDAAPPVVLNATAVRALQFANPKAAVGRFVSWRFSSEPLFRRTKLPPLRASQVIGVVPDFTFGSIREPIQPAFYYVGPKTDLANSMVLNVRIDPGQAAAVIPKIDRTWRKIKGGEPLQRVFADQYLMRLYIDTAIQGGFIAICGLIAILIASLGLFALSAYTAERRTKEIGVRKAMGATSQQVLRLLLWEFLRPVLIAILVASPIAYLAMGWWLQGFAYRVGLAPWTFAAAGAAALTIAALTVLGHGLRVASANPAGALRYE